MATADTGQGASIVLTTTGNVGLIKSITLPESTIDKLETSDLSTTGFKTYVKTDLAEPGQITAEAIFNQSSNSPLTYTSGTSTFSVYGVPQTVTVTFPIIQTTNTTAATYAGTGFITGIKMPDLKMGELNMMTYTIDLDGITPPVFTKEAA